MKNNNDLVLNVSQEELLYLLKILGAPSIPGIDPNIFEGATERDIGVAVGVAERALIARGLVVPGGDGRVNISEVALALVGTCAMPNFSVITEITTEDTAQGLFWHGTENIVVEHNLPIRGIHKFRALSDRDDLENNIVTCMPKLPKSAAEVPAGSLAVEIYEQGKEMIRDQKKTKEAEELFIKNGLPEKTAVALVKVLRLAKITISAGFLKHTTKGEPYSKGGVGAVSSRAAFLIEPEGDDQLLFIQPINDTEWKNWITKHIKAIQ